MIHLHLLTLFICCLLSITVFADDSPILDKRQRPCTAIRVLTTTTIIQTSISISLSTATETSVSTETLVSTTTATETVPTTATETSISTETLVSTITATETVPTTATETSISTATITETSVSTTTTTDISTTTDTAITITIISGSIPPPVTIPGPEVTTTTTTTATTSIPIPTTITTTTTATYTQSNPCTISSTPTPYPTPNPPLCPITSTLTLTFDDLSTSWVSSFPLSYRSFSFSGQAGWLLLNTKSRKATPQEKRGSISAPNALYSKSYGMVRFGTSEGKGNETFDLVSSWLYAYNIQASTYDQRFFWVTVRTDKMAGGDKGGPNSSLVFPYAVPLGAFKGEVMNWERLGDVVRGVRWVEMAVWKEWYWGQKGVEGNPVTGWMMDNLVVRNRKAC